MCSIVWQEIEKLGFLGRRDRSESSDEEHGKRLPHLQAPRYERGGKKTLKARGEIESSAEPGFCESIKGKVSVLHRSAASKEVSLTE